MINVCQNDYLMQITSPSFQHEQAIPKKYTCDGENSNPPLQFLDIPSGTQSLAFIMDDPDVPTSIRADGNWDHWLIWNIAPDTKEIAENSVPKGAVVGKNTGGENRYGGPCPPDRQHRYFFKLFALDTLLNLPDDTTTKADLLMAMGNHILAKAELIGRYNRT